jgi:peptide/nickel transport system permease protein
MIRYLCRKAFQAFITITAVITITFIALRFTGDPVSKLVPADATLEERNAYMIRYGLDKPKGEQFVLYMGNLLKGDLGYSMSSKRPIREIIGDRIANTIKLAVFTMAAALFFAVFLGTLSAVYRYRLIDRILLGVYAFGQAVPVFSFCCWPFCFLG